MLKYKSADVQKMVDVFAEIVENRDNQIKVMDELKKLVDYPSNVIEKFLSCMEILEDKNESYLKENYWEIIGYITMRLNFS
jgi:hypothetical protein